MSNFFSFGLGVGTKNLKGEWLEVYYHAPMLNPDSALINKLGQQLGYQEGNQAIELSASDLKDLIQALSTDFKEQADLFRMFEGSEAPLVATFLATDDAPAFTAEAYLKLQLLSNRLVKPHGINIAGIFRVLPNVAWTNEGAIDLAELPERQLKARLQGKIIEVMSVDKFPKMTNYVVPTGVRVAHTARVRLGAYVGEGTTVMHEGFINFNAGTEGPNMVEGRISAGVMVQGGSDLGGGCSTMGTLSGGNDKIISIGKDCLLGANAGVGIPLGDRCTVEAGLYVTGGSKVNLLDDQGKVVETLKAAELESRSDLLFRRNSLSGAIECKTNKSAIELNADLHSHN